jgi:hypothetical protein
MAKHIPTPLDRVACACGELPIRLFFFSVALAGAFKAPITIVEPRWRIARRDVVVWGEAGHPLCEAAFGLDISGAMWKASGIQ